MALSSGPFKTAQLWFPHTGGSWVPKASPPEVPAGSDLIFITQHQLLLGVVPALPDLSGVTDIIPTSQREMYQCLITKRTAEMEYNMGAIL